VAVVIDDQLLLEYLAGVRSGADLGDEIYTTGCWYYRLTRAVMSEPGGGSLSGRFASLGEDRQRQALEGLSQLPRSIGLLSFRTIVPIMGALRVRRPLNMLNAEALAVAVTIEADVRVSVESRLLADGAHDLDVDYDVVS
jgi:hypothetical protein